MKPPSYDALLTAADWLAELDPDFDINFAPDEPYPRLREVREVETWLRAKCKSIMDKRFRDLAREAIRRAEEAAP